MTWSFSNAVELVHLSPKASSPSIRSQHIARRVAFFEEASLFVQFGQILDLNAEHDLHLLLLDTPGLAQPQSRLVGEGKEVTIDPRLYAIRGLVGPLVRRLLCPPLG